jgi:hypothetical protein
MGDFIMHISFTSYMGDFIMHLSASEKADKCMMKSSQIGHLPTFQLKVWMMKLSHPHSFHLQYSVV